MNLSPFIAPYRSVCYTTKKKKLLNDQRLSETVCDIIKIDLAKNDTQKFS